MLGRDGARVLRAIAARGPTLHGAAIGPTLRPRFEYAIKSLRPASPQTVVEDVVEQGRHDNCWLLAGWIAVGPRDRPAPAASGPRRRSPRTGRSPARRAGPRARRPVGADGPPRRRGPLRRTRRGVGPGWPRRCDARTPSSFPRGASTTRPRAGHATLRLPLAQRRRATPPRDPRGGRPATAAGAALAATRRWRAANAGVVLQLFAAHSAVVHLPSPRGAPWRVARARAAPPAADRITKRSASSAPATPCAAPFTRRRTLPTSEWLLDLSTERRRGGTCGRARTARRRHRWPWRIRRRADGPLPPEGRLRGPGRTCGCRRQSQRRAGDRRRLGQRCVCGRDTPTRRPGAPRRRAVAGRRYRCCREHGCANAGPPPRRDGLHESRGPRRRDDCCRVSGTGRRRPRPLRRARPSACRLDLGRGVAR